MRSIGVPARSFAWLGEKKLSQIMLILGLILLLAILIGIGTFLLIQDIMTNGTNPPGVTILGVNIAGLTKAEAVDKCNEELSDVFNRPLALKIDDESYEITPQEIGLTIDIEKMVDQAYKDAWNVNIIERMVRRFLNRPKEINAAMAVQSDQGKIEKFVDSSLTMINRDPHDAYVDVTSGVPVIVPAKEGRYADRDKLMEDTIKALATPGRKVNVEAGRSPAGVSDETIGKFIIVNLSEHKLTLYNREQPMAQYGIACGSTTWPTPVGIWKVVAKQRNPSWSNPGTSWAKSMPPYIGPGPGNPLGTRALPLNASGVLIHGTSASGSIGYSVSHGCIRMRMPDVEALFEMVDAGIPVYIIRAAGDPGFDPSKKPFWQT